MALYYEDLSEGQTFTSPARTVTETDLVTFAMLSGDWNAIHTDEEFARESFYGKRVVHGLFGLSMMTGLLDRTGLFGGSAVAMLGISDWQFKAPIFVGDTLHFEMEIASKRLTGKGDRGIIDRKFSLINQRDEVTQEGHIGIMIRLKESERDKRMRLLENRVALVTGAAQGIGFAVARTFAEQGAAVVVADVSGDSAEEARAGIEKLGVEALAVEADVRDPEQVQAMVDAAVSELGSLDVLVNNAGITRDATMRKMKLDDWQAVIDVHLKGTFLATQAASAVMREQKRGAIVNISSISGKVGMAGQSNYSAAKAGIVGLTKAAAKELAHHGVRVNAIQPGLIRTAMTAALRDDIWDQKMSEIPMKRAGEPEEVAKVALFLATDLSSYMTGTVLEVTGGRYM